MNDKRSVHKFTFIISTFLLTSIFSGCNKDGRPITLNTIPEDMSLQEAKDAGFVVFEDLDVTSGQETWEKFLKNCDSGKEASVILVDYYTDESASVSYSSSIYFQELSFDGSEYHLTWNEGEKTYDYDYPYLVKYEGQPNSTTAIFSEYTYYVLVNDPTVTWNEIEAGMLSSQSDANSQHHMVYQDLIYK